MSRTQHTLRQSLHLAVVSAILMLAGPIAAISAQTVDQTGVVKSGRRALPGFVVTLYAASSDASVPSTVLGSAVTGGRGTFSISYTPPTAPGTVRYLIADGPHPGIRLATVIGVNYTDPVTINEQTTVATAWAMAQFLEDGNIGGPNPGLVNAAGILRNLVNLQNGGISAVLGKAPNGAETREQDSLNSLANMLAACVTSAIDSAVLYALATPPGGTAPDDTLEAMTNIAHFPWQNIDELWLLSFEELIYKPFRDFPPAAWTLALKYTGNGHEFDGPGAIAFDADGNAWINNNYEFQRDHSKPSCAGGVLHKLTPRGMDSSGAPYGGGGLSGAGFGICLDKDGDIWISNFGFFGTTCPSQFLPPANSVSQFRPDGSPVSGPMGYTQGDMLGPQAIVSDMEGNIWIANSCNGTVTFYRGGDPDDGWSFDANATFGSTDAKPFAIAIDADGNAWITQNRGDFVFQLDNNGNLIGMSSGATGLNAPMGIAIDSLGNLWVADSAIVDMPCLGNAGPYGRIVDPDEPFGPLVPDFDGAGVTLLDSSGAATTMNLPFQGGGVFIPWGIAVDGNDNVWVASFGGRRVTQLRGANPATFPFTGVAGDPISPSLGFKTLGLERSTGISIDSSGNVWVTNNWLDDAVQTNPGGDGVVVFVGLAGPVKTPLIGPVRQP